MDLKDKVFPANIHTLPDGPLAITIGDTVTNINSSQYRGARFQAISKELDRPVTPSDPNEVDPNETYQRDVSDPAVQKTLTEEFLRDVLAWATTDYDAKREKARIEIAVAKTSTLGEADKQDVMGTTENLIDQKLAGS